MRRAWPVVLFALALLAPAARAHPVPSTNHDRTIVVHLGWDGPGRQYLVVVDYRLELDPLMVARDMAALEEPIDVRRVREGEDGAYGEFMRLYAPILAGNLTARANGNPLAFTCSHRQHSLADEKGQSLGHVRCDFRFRAGFPPAAGQPQRFEFKEANYQLEPGKIDLSLVGDASIRILGKAEPDAALKARPETQLDADDEERLRQVSADFEATEARRSEPALPRPAGAADHDSLLRLFLDSDQGLLWLLLLAVALGAAHALTPGHGKTLVAAYLVGEHGTTLHAVVLGLVTTLTHTGVVFLFAVGLLFLSDEARRAVAGGLGLGAGLLVFAYGAWVLLRRLSGRADHVHIGGHGHHHHDHAHADHDHDEHGNVVPRKKAVGWWGLLVLGMTGGIVPCWDAVAMLVLAVGMGQLWLALPVLVAFSAGLAGVLVLVGVLVVHVRGFAQSHWGEGRLVRALPIVSAVVITVMGIWLCYDSVHGGI